MLRPNMKEVYRNMDNIFKDFLNEEVNIHELRNLCNYGILDIRKYLIEYKGYVEVKAPIFRKKE